MSKIFSDAISNVFVRVNPDGGRSVSGSSGMNRGANNHRGYNRGRGSGGQRWQRGGRNNSRGFGRGIGNHSRNREDDEGDFVMSEGRNSYGTDSYNRDRRNRNGRERSPESSSRDPNNTGWWKVIVVEGRKHNRDWLLRRLNDTCRVRFNAVDYSFQGSNAVFYINDALAVEPLKDTSNRITTKDSSKIRIIVSPSPIIPRDCNDKRNDDKGFDEEFNTALKQCLSTRFEGSPLLKLNLSRLHFDSHLKQANIQGRADQPKFMNAILELIYSFCPNLKILDLSDNRIFRLDNLRLLDEKCPTLEELNLSDNEIRSTIELIKINKHPTLAKLWFKGNPGEVQFANNNSSYLSEVRRRIPNLKELDGIELPPTLKFELDTKSNIPPSKPFYAPEGRDYELVKVFVRNFYLVYDDDDVSNRQKLLDAYHNDAVFSLCCNTAVQLQKNNLFNTYKKLSRNLKCLKDTKQKSQLIKRKKINVVAFLTELPQTKHWLDSFSLDLTLSTLHMLCFTVQGVFVEGKDHTPRGFSRTFIGARNPDQTFQVVNDELHIRSPTAKQLEALEKFKSNKPDPTAQASSSASDVIYTPEQQALVKKFSSESQMNLEYSLQCLVASSWNYQLAASKFMELKKNKKIPPEAFVNP